MSRWSLPVLVFLALVASPAGAAPSPRFELSVVRLEGAGACPDRATLERGVAARLGRVPFAEPAQRTLEAVLSRREQAWRAEITLRDAEGIELGRRSIEAAGPDCSPLAEATTLALALTIDPDAALGTAPPVPPLEPDPEVRAPAPPAACPDRACPASAPCPKAVCPHPPARPYVGASARATLALGLIPGPAPGVALVTEGGSQTLRAEVSLLFLPETRADDPRFAFGLTAAAAGACAAPQPFGRFELGLCGEIQLGAIHAVVHEAAPIDPGDQLWVAAALGPRLGLEVAPPLAFEVGVSAVAPLLDRSFDVVGIEQPVFRPAAVGAVGFVGVGIRAR
jgi:hypothetical protein